MAVVAVAEDSARYDAMDTNANCTNIGGGAGTSIEPDIIYQGTAAVSRKVTGAGFFTDTGAARDMTATGRRTLICKAWLTNYASLSTTGNKLEVRIGSGTSAYHAYVLADPSTAYPSRGGWIITAIDPNIASHRSSTSGSPALTACDYFAAYADCSTSKVENLVLDAIDVGVGLYLTGGDGGDTDGTFLDFVADDEGDSTNGRFGYVTTQGGVVYALGSLIIGATSVSGTRTSVATGFADSRVVVFPDHLAAAGYSGLVLDLGNASTIVNLSGCVFSSRGTSTGEDTRAVLDVFGTNGTATIDASTLTGFASFTLTSGVTLDACTISETETITQAGATISGCSIGSSPVASGSACLISDDISLVTDCTFTSGGTGHAIEITAAGTYTLSGASFSGYGADGTNDAAIYNNSGGAVTINLTGGGTVPTVRNGTGASTTLVSSNTLTLTGLKNPSEVRVFDASSPTTEITGQEDVTTGTFSAGIDAATYPSIIIHILSLGFQMVRLVDVDIAGGDVTIPIQQPLDRQYLNP